MNKHWVKVLGGLAVVLGFVQVYPGLSTMMSVTAYTWLMLAIGVGGAVLGVFRKVDTTNWLNQWKTVLVGGVTAGISVLQGFGALKTLISAGTYSWVMFFCGLALAVCGVINTMSDDSTTTGGGGT